MLNYNRWILTALLSVGIMGTSALGKTKLVQSWADPSAANYQFSKVLAVAVVERPEIRRTAEGAIVKNMKNIRAVPSYTILETGAGRDIESAKRKVREGGFDGAIVVRFFNVGDKLQYAAPNFPNNTYTSYWSFYNYAWPTTADPGYLKYDLIVQIETLFYSVKDDKILWSAISETSNPQNATALIDGIAKVISKELRKKGIIK
jgi:hypothetical protein